jgi:hypothetical protein
MLKRALRFIAALSFSSTAFTMAAPAVFADSVSTEGPDSSVHVTASNNTTVTNNNNVTITNTTTQTASSGNATVSNNTTGGNATSGNASNSNSTSVDLVINNISSMPSGGGSGSASTQGPNSPISIHERNNSTVTNNNNVRISNSATQNASTGNARVSNNTTGGNATSGNASNSNDTCVSISIRNSGEGTSAGNTCANQPGGGSGGGNTGQPSGGAGGQVLGAALTVASITGGRGAGAFAQLPNTGLKNGVNAWALTTVLTLLATAAYWRLAITPKLKNN